MKSVLFVCLGNICRSPLVEAVARDRFADAGLSVQVASCGTGGWHVGETADPRAIQAAQRAGYDLTPHRARQLEPDDYARHDLILCMDGDNLAEVRSRRRGTTDQAVMALFLDFAGVEPGGEVPDPYYGGEGGFRHVVGLAEQGVDGLIARLR